ncbi:MAG: hypothetical protein LBV04_00750 [Deferribacteraceae bacterium]|jgi:hypothetical protein|nr:hypothetical protein [Deferribacteraceae bacterium]
MNEKELFQQINFLTNIHAYTVYELEKMLVYLYRNRKFAPIKRKWILRKILRARRDKINQDFVWSEENRAQFLAVNKQIANAYEQISKAYKEIDDYLSPKASGRFGFGIFVDFGLQTCIRPYMEKNHDCEFFDNVLLSVTGVYDEAFPRFNQQASDISTININKRLAGIIDVELNDVTYYLLENYWTFIDIINISHIWTTIRADLWRGNRMTREHIEKLLSTIEE